MGGPVGREEDHIARFEIPMDTPDLRRRHHPVPRFSVKTHRRCREKITGLVMQKSDAFGDAMAYGELCPKI